MSIYYVNVYVNDNQIEMLVDTGSDVNVMSLQEASNIGITNWVKIDVKLRPYGSEPLKVCGVHHGTIGFKSTSVEAKIYIVKQPLETLLSGNTAEKLGIISFHTINMIDNSSSHVDIPHSDDKIINDILQKFPNVFRGIGMCKYKTIDLHVKENPKPLIQPVRPIPYHLRDKFDEAISEMISYGIFEEYNGPNEWLSNPVIIPKDDNSVRVTIDFRHSNNSLINSHSPIPRIDDLKVAVNGCKFYSKLDLKQAYFQFPISEESRKLTTFYANGKLLRLTRLPQGIISASSELNNCLRQIFSNVPEIHPIHDDLLLAT